MTDSIQPSPAPATPTRRRRTWRTLVGIVVVAALAIGAGFLLSKCAASAPPAQQFGRGARPTITVGIAQAATGDVPITVTALGTVTPEATVSVISRVTGQLKDVRFREGQMVRKGDVLAVIDPAPFEAALNQAQGTLARDQALLVNARLDLQRYNTLVAENSVARQTRDTQASLVRQDEGLVASDRGAVAAAQLNLQWTRILSPVPGRVGLRQIDVGNQISANGTTPIAVVTQIDPIDVIFAVPEDAIPAIVRHPGFGAGLPVTAYDRTGGSMLGTGSLATIDNIVDTTTGTVKGKARFANPAGTLFPNQFVNIAVLVDTLKRQVIVPTTAIRHGPNGDFVWLLQEDGKTVQSQPVKTGPGTGETTSIVSGLSAGQTVITEGGDRLRDGAPVTLPRGANVGDGEGGRRGRGRNRGDDAAAAGAFGGGGP
ncbi:MAG TPA: MdtA/MuxA family multidrug efflux RND transporter periplasmic adaptor subunit [Caulobacteraceae bacterium]|nr:MdtA/MuxA family multidrug efflux RND transporter periplasmic adaptor subunit [Caulobacteraceae bacterium]